MNAGARASVVAGCLVGACALGVTVGYGDLSTPGLGEELLRLRTFRVLTALGAGAALSIAGVLVQGLFRNPLASPSVLGVSAGASFGGQLALLVAGGVGPMVLPASMAPEMFLPLGCLAGALGALVLLLALARVRPEPLTILLAGFLLSGLFVSIGAFLTAYGQKTWELGRAIVLFTLGGVSGAGMRHAILVCVLAIISGVFAMGWSRALDVLATGDEEARSLGVDTRRLRRWVVVWAAVASAAAVAVGGNIAFVGLVVPHAARAIVGERHRILIPAAAVLGATYLVLADVVCRIAPGAAELPLGVVTGLVGAPTFLLMLFRMQRRGLAGG